MIQKECSHLRYDYVHISAKYYALFSAIFCNSSRHCLLDVGCIADISMECFVFNRGIAEFSNENISLDDLESRPSKEMILEKLESYLGRFGSCSIATICITDGNTHFAIDPIRYGISTK